MRGGSRLDAIDIRILSALQRHGRLSKTRLADLVNLSPTPCGVRLKRLESAGYVRGFHADIALDRVADVTRVIVTVSLAYHRRADFDRFEAHVLRHGDIVECIATGGGTDYVLKVVSPTLSAFQDLMAELLAAELGIERYMTYIVTREVKSARPDLERLAAQAERRPGTD